MLAIVTPEEMAAIDAAAPEPVDVLIGRAGAAVARAALERLGGGYGRRVVVLAGKGNNGNDGRDAARRLARRGVRVQVVDVAGAPATLPSVDLVLDAAFGTGFRGEWRAPEVPPGTAVLAVDIPSGVDGVTGEVGEGSRVLAADATVTFAALKPGLVLAAGHERAGAVSVVDIGLDTSSARAHLVTDDDVRRWWPVRPEGDHKWRSAVWVVGGSPGMDGAVALTCAGAQRTGAGYVRCSIPGGGDAGGRVAVEVVQVPLPRTGWWPDVAPDLERFSALVVGNGLGRDAGMASDVRAAATAGALPVVLDADALVALGVGATGLGPQVVLTPHDGEYAALAGHGPGPDRLGATRDLARRTGAVVVLKGGPTVVAHPDGRVLVAAAGDARLATAGTGDVLAGMVGALCARGLEPFRAAAVAAHLHGRAGALGWRIGLAAGDLPDLVPAALEAMGVPGRG